MLTIANFVSFVNSANIFKKILKVSIVVSDSDQRWWWERMASECQSGKHYELQGNKAWSA